MQSDQEGEGQSRTPLEDVLLRRQQQQIEVINPVNMLTGSSMAEKSHLIFRKLPVNNYYP